MNGGGGGDAGGVDGSVDEDVFRFKVAAFFTVIVVSLVGGFLPLRINMGNDQTRKGIIDHMRFLTAGVFLGVGLLHMLPDAVEGFQALDWSLPSAFNIVTYAWRDHLRHSPSNQPLLSSGDPAAADDNDPFPIPYLLCALGFILVWYAEQRFSSAAAPSPSPQEIQKMMAVAAGAESLGGGSICYVQVQPVASYGPVQCPSPTRIRSAAALAGLPQSAMQAAMYGPASVSSSSPLGPSGLSSSFAGGSAAGSVSPYASPSPSRFVLPPSASPAAAPGALGPHGAQHPQVHAHEEPGDCCHSQGHGDSVCHHTDQQQQGREKQKRKIHEHAQDHSHKHGSSNSHGHAQGPHARSAHHHAHEWQDEVGVRWRGVQGGTEDDACAGLHRHTHTTHHHHIVLPSRGGLSYLLTALLSMHSFVVGAALGTSGTLQGTVGLIIALIAHKWAEAFAVGVQFVRESVPVPKMAAILLLYCAMTPTGIVVGMLANSLAGPRAMLVAVVTQAFGAGTVLYIAMLELVEKHSGAQGRGFLIQSSQMLRVSAPPSRSLLAPESLTTAAKLTVVASRSLSAWQPHSAAAAAQEPPRRHLRRSTGAPYFTRLPDRSSGAAATASLRLALTGSSATPSHAKSSSLSSSCSYAPRFACTSAVVSRARSAPHSTAPLASTSASTAPAMATKSARAAEALQRVKDAGLFRDQCLIGDSWVGPRDAGPTMDVVNPATGDLITRIPNHGYDETRQAIAAASAAFPDWSSRSAKERAAVLRKWYDLIVANREELALLMTLEQGKPLAEARGEVDYSAGYVQLYAEEATRTYGDIIPAPLADRRILVQKQPVGVVAVITPWNFPLAMIARKVAPALAAGCTVVAKPSELTPLSAFALAELALKAGVPHGVINIVVGDAPPIGQAIMESSAVRKLSFTGSTAVGRRLMAGAAATVKRVSLELGGNAPFIVFDDADVAVAVKGLLAAKFRNAGQTCVCANRVLVQEGIYDEFVAAVKTAMEQQLTVGFGLEDGVTQGPLINQAAVEKVQSHVDDAVSRGGKVLLGGSIAHPSFLSAPAGELPEKLPGCFFQPTLVVDVPSDCLCFQEETFGPLAAVHKFSSEADALRIANDSEFGLAAYVFSRDMGRCFTVAEGLQAGIVGVNESAISTEVAPFGGVKQSGMGREGSRYGLQDYMDLKYVCLGNLNAGVVVQADMEVVLALLL
ncbi:unnamed protein product [Closterium sp. NIES-64]|nr:unnamed protein product [Closterium sp. NIES-64]